MKILANDGLSEDAVQYLKDNGCEVSTTNIPQDQLINYINEQKITVLSVRSATKVRKDIIDACPSLQIIGRGGVGMDNIDVEYARSKGIQVINTPAASSHSVGELVFAHLFGLARFLYDANREMPQNGAGDFKALKKKYAKGFELKGSTIGIIGFGRIGQATAKIALGLGMKVIVADHTPGEYELELDIQGAGEVKVKITSTNKEEVLKNADVITLHVPAQEDGTPVLGANEFKLMKDGVVVINAARGGVIDEDALIDALNSGKVASAGLDVFVNEPTPREDILSHEKISLSPHIGAATNAAQQRIGFELADQILSFYKVSAN